MQQEKNSLVLFLPIFINSMDQKVILKKDGQEFAGSLSQSFISNVFSYMFAALSITGVIAYWFGTNETLLSYLINPETGSMTGLGMLVTFSPLAFVLVISFGFQRLSSMVLLLFQVLWEFGR